MAEKNVEENKSHTSTSPPGSILKSRSASSHSEYFDCLPMPSTSAVGETPSRKSNSAHSVHTDTPATSPKRSTISFLPSVSQFEYTPINESYESSYDVTPLSSKTPSRTHHPPFMTSHPLESSDDSEYNVDPSEFNHSGSKTYLRRPSLDPSLPATLVNTQSYIMSNSVRNSYIAIGKGRYADELHPGFIVAAITVFVVVFYSTTLWLMQFVITRFSPHCFSAFFAESLEKEKVPVYRKVFGKNA